MLGCHLIPSQLTTEVASPTELENNFRSRDSLSSIKTNKQKTLMK